MLPDLDQQLQKKKKKKKEKKKKKKKGEESDSDDWEESENNVSKKEAALEKVSKEAGVLQQRDEFMEMGFLASYSKNERSDRVSTKDRKAAEKQAQEEARAAVGASRELNPGMRQQMEAALQPETREKMEAAAPSAAAAPVKNKSGDGGLGWLLKAFKRAEEQALEGGVAVEEIAEKRWGGLASFFELVEKARMKAAHIDRRVREDLNRIDGQYKVKEKREEGKRERRRSRSRERKRSRSKSRERSRSRSRSRSKSRER